MHNRMIRKQHLKKKFDIRPCSVPLKTLSERTILKYTGKKLPGQKRCSIHVLSSARQEMTFAQLTKTPVEDLTRMALFFKGGIQSYMSLRLYIEKARYELKKKKEKKKKWKRKNRSRKKNFSYFYRSDITSCDEALKEEAMERGGLTRVLLTNILLKDSKYEHKSSLEYEPPTQNLKGILIQENGKSDIPLECSENPDESVLLSHYKSPTQIQNLQEVLCQENGECAKKADDKNLILQETLKKIVLDLVSQVAQEYAHRTENTTFSVTCEDTCVPSIVDKEQMSSSEIMCPDELSFAADCSAADTLSESHTSSGFDDQTNLDSPSSEKSSKTTDLNEPTRHAQPYIDAHEVSSSVVEPDASDVQCTKSVLAKLESDLRIAGGDGACLVGPWLDSEDLYRDNPVIFALTMIHHPMNVPPSCT